MIGLIIIVLLSFLGFYQSIIELRKDKNEENSKRNKTLSRIYFYTFILGIGIAAIQFFDSKRMDKVLDSISLRITSIDSSFNKQLTQIEDFVDKTDNLLVLSDTVNSKMLKVVNQSDSLTIQYEKVNKQLDKQIEIEKQKLESNTPIITTKDSFIKWEKIDSISQQLSFYFMNSGKRNVFVHNGEGYILFLDKGNKPFLKVDFRDFGNGGILEPYSEIPTTMGSISNKVIHIEKFNESNTYAAIVD